MAACATTRKVGSKTQTGPMQHASCPCVTGKKG